MSANRPLDVALLCNPLAGGRWRVLADVLDSDEAKSAHRIVTDEISDVGEALAGLGQRVKLLCIYGGDGTIYRVINEILRDRDAALPRLALLGGGTMNVTARWCGMRDSPGETFRHVMRAYAADRLLWREVPLLAVTHGGQTQFGFTVGFGPLVRVLERFESGEKSPLKALQIGLQSALSAVSGIPRAYQSVLRQMNASVTVDGERLPYDRWVTVFGNVTGTVNPFIEPFVGERTRNSFHFLAYAVSSREFAMMAPLLARGHVPVDPRSLLNPVSAWRQALLSVVGQGQLPSDPRYVNRPAHHVVIDTSEPFYTIDGEVFPSRDKRFEVRLGPLLHLATLGGRRSALKDRSPSRPQPA